MDKTKQNKPEEPSLLDRFEKILGVGLYLLLIGLLLEVLTIILRQWVSFPFSLSTSAQIAFTIPCVLACLSGIVWFNTTLNLFRIHFLNGENPLITTGPFNYVRHPLYAALMISLPPLFLIWFADLLFLLPWIFIYIVAHFVVSVEEKGLLELFGEEYKAYRKHVPALIPYKGAGGARYRAVHHTTASSDDV